MNSAARSSSSPPISPIRTTPAVPGIRLEEPQELDEARADHRVPAHADARGLPHARARERPDHLVGERPAARDHPDVPLLVDAARHDSRLARRPGVMSPGQLGPMSRQP